MLLNKHEQKEKQALKAVADFWDLSKQYYSNRWVPCEPFQHGWIRDYELRADVANRDDAKMLRQIVARIGRTQWCKEKEFFTIDKWRKKSERKKALPEPGLDVIHIRLNEEGVETGWPFPESFKKWFYYHGVNYPGCYCFQKRLQYYRPAHYFFKFPWMFDLRVRPAFISKVSIINGEVETQLSYLKRKMDDNNYWHTYRRIRGYHRDDYKEFRRRCQEQDLDQDIKQQLEEIKNYERTIDNY